MEQIKIDVVKQWLINKKEFSPLEVIEALEKENEELKAEIENLKKTYRKQRNKRIDELQKENKELKEKISAWENGNPIGELLADKEYLDKVNNEQTEVILKLQAQIEKMKYCENCKHSYTDSENNVFCYLPFSQEDCKSCKLYNHKDTDNDYWELAE